MQYISIYLENEIKPIICIDLKDPEPLDIIDAIYYADKFNPVCFQSNYKNIYTAKFKRTAESSDKVTSEQIVWWDVPKRLTPDEVIAILVPLQRRGKDKAKRTMHPNSLANLKPAKIFTSEHRPHKPRKLSEEQLKKAEELRGNGCSWRTVGDLLTCNAHTVRSSLKRRLKEAGNLN